MAPIPEGRVTRLPLQLVAINIRMAPIPEGRVTRLPLQLVAINIRMAPIPRPFQTDAVLASHFPSIENAYVP